MGKRKTKEQFIEEAINVHGKDRYDYSKVEYKNNRNKIEIYCKKCNKTFWQRPYGHLNGRGCPYCAGKNKTTNDFIIQAQKVHGKNKYDYSKVEYINTNEKVKIFCNTCKRYFWQTPHHHLKGCGCRICGWKTTSIKQTKLLEDFIKESIRVHGRDKYDYSEVEYKNTNTKIKIFCNKCKKYFFQLPTHHLKGCGCPTCIFNSKKRTLNQFIEQSIKVHGKDKYDYSEVEYINNRTKVKIFCNKCKKYFWQSPDQHINGKNGCPNCCPKSKGEENIKEYLDRYNIVYIREKRFKDCRDKNPLPFDFYLPDYNICIEYQGEQHYRSSFFISLYKSNNKGIQQYNLLKLHDKIKKNYCYINNIELLEIKYNDDIISKLNKKLNKKGDKNENRSK